MILSDRDLIERLQAKQLIIEPMNMSQVGPSSVDLRLGSTLVRYTGSLIKLGETVPEFEEEEIDSGTGFYLQPKEFILGSTLERITMPSDLQGFIETKGDIARAGLQVHNADGHIDPGTNHTITLEISNLNSIPVVLYPGIFICQIFIHTLSSPCANPYHGKYYGQIKPSTYLPKKQ